MTAFRYLPVILSFGVLASSASAEEKEILIDSPHVTAAKWLSAKIDVAAEDNKFVAQLATAVESTRLKYMSVRPVGSHGGRTMAVPADLLKSIENPLVAGINISTGPSSIPLIMTVAMRYGKPVLTSTLSCSAELKSEVSFPQVIFGFDFETRHINRRLMDPCFNVVEESGDIAVK
jgi:hypothetical protein